MEDSNWVSFLRKCEIRWTDVPSSNILCIFGCEEPFIGSSQDGTNNPGGMWLRGFLDF